MMPTLYPSMDTQRGSPMSCLEASVSDRLEQELSSCGFMPVVEEPYVYSLVHRSCHAVQVPTRYENQMANINAQIAILLPYMLCACRFAHYIKVLARDKIGSFMSANECEQYLQGWIYKYCGQVAQENSEQSFRYPLKDAKIKVGEAEGQPGRFLCEIEIKPNYHIEQINTKLRFTSFLNHSEALS